VFYDVTGEAVQVLAIVQKSETDVWLAQHGESMKQIALLEAGSA
jgi:hypothetical protein